MGEAGDTLAVLVGGEEERELAAQVGAVGGHVDLDGQQPYAVAFDLHALELGEALQRDHADVGRLDALERGRARVLGLLSVIQHRAPSYRGPGFRPALARWLFGGLLRPKQCKKINTISRCFLLE